MGTVFRRYVSGFLTLREQRADVTRAVCRLCPCTCSVLALVEAPGRRAVAVQDVPDGPAWAPAAWLPCCGRLSAVG
jgi:hypothetical protein